MQRLLQASVQLHGPAAQEKEVVVDTTVQEKNITYPTESKLAIKIINRLNSLPRSMASNKGVLMSREY